MQGGQLPSYKAIRRDYNPTYGLRGPPCVNHCVHGKQCEVERACSHLSLMMECQVISYRKNVEKHHKITEQTTNTKGQLQVTNFLSK